MRLNAYTVLVCLLCFGVVLSYRPYPISGSWFKNRNNAPELNSTLKQYKSIGGDTVFLTGAEYKIRQPDDIRRDPDFKDCVIDGVDCVSSAQKLLRDRGIVVSQWLTYSDEANYTEQFAVCEGLDRRIQIGKKVYYQIFLWPSNEEPADCRFYRLSQASVLFTYYSGEPDPSQLMLTQAKALNMSVYLGLPQPPNNIRDLHQAINQPFFLLNYRIMADHRRRGFYNNTAMKGYYSNAEVVAYHIINPQKAAPPYTLDPRDVLYLWRKLSFRAHQFNTTVIGAPSVDLTHEGNTTLQGHVDGIRELQVWTWMPNFIIRDGRATGKAAYYWPIDHDQPISYRDKKLVELLKQRNSTVNDRTSYIDIYYASIHDFLFLYNNASKPAWLMIEAFEEIKSEEACGDSARGRRIEKGHLDRALTRVSSMVEKVTAYAWDPYFTCNTTKDKTPLVDNIRNEMNKSLASECRFLDPPNNLTIEMTGFNLDSPGKFRVAYQFFTAKEGVDYIAANYVEKDYGIKHGLVDSLEYVEIPFEDFSDLARNGTIMVLKLDNYNSYCQFSYSLPDQSLWSSVNYRENELVG